MKIQPTQQMLLTAAEQFVQQFVMESGAFSMFALVLKSDGEVIPMQTSDEFDSVQSALGGVLQALAPMATDGVISGCVICTPMEAEGMTFALYDVDHQQEGRFVATQRYKKKFFGGWAFEEKSYAGDTSRLFAS